MVSDKSTQKSEETTTVYGGCMALIIFLIFAVIIAYIVGYFNGIYAAVDTTAKGVRGVWDILTE